MLNSIRARVSLLVVSMSVVPILAVFLIFSHKMHVTLINQREQEMEKVINYLNTTFAGFENKATTYANLLDNILEIQDALTFAISTQDRSGLSEVMRRYYDTIELDILNVINTDGKMVVRAGADDKFGDDNANKTHVKAALGGKLALALELGLRGWGIRAASPVEAGEGLIGVIEVGELVDDDFAKAVSRATLTEVSFFYKDAMIASSFSGKAKEEAQGILKEVITAKKGNTDIVDGKPFYFSSSSHSIGKTQAPIELAIGISATPIIEAEKRMRFVLVSALLAVGVLAIFLGYMFARKLTQPLLKLSEVFKDIAEGEGDLTKRLEVDRKDETGEVALWFNTFVEKLRDIIKVIATNAETLSKSSMDLSGLSAKMSGGADNMSSRSSSVATSAEEMSASITSVSVAMEQACNNTKAIATAIEEMTSTIGEVAKNAENARTISSDAVSQAKNASSRVDELGKAAEEIGKVTEAITEISEQTNLLALNATIEAARAGEAGKGFAVVANEIKDLARQTATATEEIKKQIEGIQGSIGATVSEIGQISDVINKVNEIVSVIAAAVEEQAIATREISGNLEHSTRGIENANEKVSEGAAGAADIAGKILEVNLSANEISTSSAQVNLSAKDLSGMATHLKETVGKFRIQ